MLKNYLIVAWRNLIKNKLYSTINITGLAIGFACCLAIGLYIWDEYSYDRFHANKENIYRLTTQAKQTGGTYDLAVTPGPLSIALEEEFPEIIQTCRIGRRRTGLLELNEKIFEPSNIAITDNSLFNLFDFKLILGNPTQALLQPDDILISEKLAIQCFGKDWLTRDSLLGTIFKYNTDRLVKLVGVVADPPVNSSIQFDLILSMEYEANNEIGFNWNSNNFHTYIQVNPAANIDELKYKVVGFIGTKNKYEKDTKLLIQPLLDIHLHSNFAFQTDWTKTSNMVYIRIFLAVGLIVLLIALFNFINLSTAKAVQRLREVGVRKAIGAERIQLVAQFLGESLMLASLSIILAFGLLFGFLPILNSIAAKSLQIPYSLSFLSLLLGFTLVSGFLAGIYPALYLSGFKPVKVLKGIFEVHSGVSFRQILVVSQFSLSIILIIGTLVIYRQLRFIQSKDLGFNQAQLVSVRLKDKLRTNSNLIKQELLAQSSILSTAPTSHSLIDVISSTGMVKWQGQLADQKLQFTSTDIDHDYLKTTGIQLIAGRNYDPSVSMDTSSSYIINETASLAMGWIPQEAIGKSFSIWNRPGNIIGVVKDFHFKPLTAPMGPFVFRYVSNPAYSYLFVKIEANKIHEALMSIEKTYKKFEPGTSFQYEFVNELVENQYKAQQRSGKVVLYFSILTIFISCLGLYGLVTFSTQQKAKQIGIRKVFGASVPSIVQLLSREFIKLVLIAILIAVPCSIGLMYKWLQGFAYKIELEWWMFTGSAILVLGIALFTLSFQTIKSALANPVKSISNYE